jgi:hypothetical protein
MIHRLETCLEKANRCTVGFLVASLRPLPRCFSLYRPLGFALTISADSVCTFALFVFFARTVFLPFRFLFTCISFHWPFPASLFGLPSFFQLWQESDFGGSRFCSVGVRRILLPGLGGQSRTQLSLLPRQVGPLLGFLFTFPC